MAKKINGIVLTEKGAIKKIVRDTIADKEISAFTNALVDFEKVENKNVMYKEYVDNKGNKVYATFTLTIGTTDPSVEKPKATKKASTDPETFEIVD